MIRPPFVNDQIYHVYNRGVEKRDIFMDDKDRFRFIHDLFEFNDKAPATNIYYKLSRLQSYEIRSRKRRTLVEILAFCLMKNHFHLLLRQRVDGGITNFMQKLGVGYTMSFNKKYKRVGSLFQGRFKAILVERDEHLLYLPFYIHLNPLDQIAPEWREREIKNAKQAMKFLESYRWSSFPDYIGIKNFPSITQRDFLLKFFEGPDQYRKDTIEWLTTLNLEPINDLLLE